MVHGRVGTVSHFSSSGVRCACRIALCAWACAVAAPAEQVWLGRSISVQATESLKLSLSNTTYIEHEKHFANEEAASFRWTFAPGWSAGAGITFGQDRIEHHWVWSNRPTEHVAVDWRGDFGGWSLFDSNRFDLKFRKGERDWVVYRQIATVTAPVVPHIPWTPRPYLSQQIYVSSRECFSGLDRFSQFRWSVGVRLTPTEPLHVSAYWQYRDIEQPEGNWTSFRIAGLSAALVF